MNIRKNLKILLPAFFLAVLLLQKLPGRNNALHPHEVTMGGIFRLPLWFTGNTLKPRGNDTLPEDTGNGESILFQSIEYLTEAQVYKLIDSLLDEESVPLDLVHEIKLYVKSRYSSEEFSAGEIDTIVRPAQQYYKGWDTYNTHPYSDALSAHDTSVELILEDGSRRFVPPVIGIMTSPFGDHRNHNGVDIDLEVWDHVVAAFDGMVRIARRHGGYGRVVMVRHYNGLETLYAHLHRIKVKPGDIVKAGELIGLGGSSGHSTGSHLHFECRFKGKPINPQYLIDFKNNQLYADTVIFKKNSFGYSVFPENAIIHTVQKGDFLLKIAEKYSIPVKRICELNGISRKSVLWVGQKLRIG